MLKKSKKKLASAILSAAVMASALSAPFAFENRPSVLSVPATVTANAADSAITIADMPSEYQYAADWIYQNRVQNEDSMGTKSKRWNSLFDQIIANNGELNYVVRWQSTQTITYEQRKQFETLVETGVNQWASWLAGYENWPFDHIKVNIVGWAVLDRNSLLDIHDDEVFAAIEKGAPAFDKGNDEHKFLYAYKAFIFEYYKKLVEQKAFQRMIKAKPSVLKSRMISGKRINIDDIYGILLSR